MLEVWMVPVAIVILYLLSSIKIHAQGEFEAAEKPAMAAEQIQSHLAAIQLRYLPTLVEIGTENTTVVFPLPVDMMSSIGRVLERLAKGPKPA